jgi:outer membrane protein OmpA-like peptidoglycan-associated protein
LGGLHLNCTNIENLAVNLEEDRTMLKSLFPVVAAALLLGACNQTPPPPQAAAPPAQRAMASRQMAPATVYFDTGSSSLSPQSMTTIRQVAADSKTTGNATVTLSGHTDTVGSQDFNMALSQRRADAVRNALVREGVPAAAITTGAQGEASLPVQTADNVDERRNRSVDIAVVGQMARAGMTDAEYCAALSRTYRDVRTSQADETAAAAMAQCQAGNTAAGIPVLEQTLTMSRIPLPSRY